MTTILAIDGDCRVHPGWRDKWGYVRTKVAHGRRGYAHRLAFEDAYGPIPNGLLVCHRCDNPPCINPAHLFLGTQADNLMDMDAKGRRVRGMTHGRARLTDADVRLVRELRESGVGLNRIADQFGVHISTVSKIALRKAWKHVP